MKKKLPDITEYFNVDIRKNIHTHEYYINPMTKVILSPTMRASAFTKHFDFLDKDSSAEDLWGKILSALKVSKKILSITPKDEINNSNFHELPLKEKNWKEVDKNWYDITLSERVVDKCYRISLWRMSPEGVFCHPDDKDITLPLSATPEQIGQAVLDGFDYIEKKWEERKKKEGIE